MAILNVTPDSFSDGGRFISKDDALKYVEKSILEGADILDIGGESTRPNSKRIAIDEELERVIPVIKAISDRFEIPISVDTSKAEVAEAAIKGGAEIINDISGLKFDENIAKVAGESGAGLILMHLRGNFEDMHQQVPIESILPEVFNGFDRSIEKAKTFGVKTEQICLDVGVGFSKTFEQNLELIAKLNELIKKFKEYPMLVGTSRKSFIGKILGEPLANKRLVGTVASNVIASWNGANIVRVHDVKETVRALRVVEAIKKEL